MEVRCCSERASHASRFFAPHAILKYKVMHLAFLHLAVLTAAYAAKKLDMPLRVIYQKNRVDCLVSKLPSIRYGSFLCMTLQKSKNLLDK